MDQKLRKKILIGVGVAIIALMALSAGIQTFAGRSSSGETSRQQTGTPIATSDTNADGKPTKLALATAISKQADEQGLPTFSPRADLVLAVEEPAENWFVVTLNVAGIDTDTTIALVKFTAPGTLTLVSGPGHYFNADWLNEDGVPQAVITNLVARNEDDH